jgi:hypothetical protein
VKSGFVFEKSSFVVVKFSVVVVKSSFIVVKSSFVVEKSSFVVGKCNDVVVKSGFIVVKSSVVVVQSSDVIVKFRTLQKAEYISVLSRLTSSGIRRIVLHILIHVSEKPAAPISIIHDVLVHIYQSMRCHIQKTVVLILNTKSSTVHTGLSSFRLIFFGTLYYCSVPS